MKSSMILLLVLVAGAAWAADVYKWDDENGIVRYSDRAPPVSAKNVQKYKSTAAGLILEKPVAPVQNPGEAMQKPKQENAQAPADKLPVVVYSFDECGEVCKQAEDFLNKRGVPYTRKGDNNAKIELQKLTGKLDVPVMVIGNTAPISGFQEERWNKELDLAGYTNNPNAKNPAGATPASQSKASNAGSGQE
jgi:glutaredoxin